jgi:hypothetical protein
MRSGGIPDARDPPKNYGTDFYEVHLYEGPGRPIPDATPVSDILNPPYNQRLWVIYQTYENAQAGVPPNIEMFDPTNTNSAGAPMVYVLKDGKLIKAGYDKYWKKRCP